MKVMFVAAVLSVIVMLCLPTEAFAQCGESCDIQSSGPPCWFCDWSIAPFMCRAFCINPGGTFWITGCYENWCFASGNGECGTPSLGADAESLFIASLVSDVDVEIRLTADETERSKPQAGKKPGTPRLRVKEIVARV